MKSGRFTFRREMKVRMRTSSSSMAWIERPVRRLKQSAISRSMTYQPSRTSEDRKSVEEGSPPLSAHAQAIYQSGGWTRSRP